jgi:hypothetical protein
MRPPSASAQIFLSLLIAAFIVPDSRGQQPLWTQMQDQAQRQQQAQQRQDAEKSAEKQKKSRPKKEDKKKKSKKQTAPAPDSVQNDDQK